MKKIFNNLWWKYKFRHFVFVHALLLIGLLSIPFNPAHYLYDLLIFITVTWPVYAMNTHVFVAHQWCTYRNRIFKLLMLCYLNINTFWRFQDMRCYHIQHHATWGSKDDPTGNEVRQGWLKYYMGVTEPVTIKKYKVKYDEDTEFFARNLWTIKIILFLTIWLVFGWTIFVHLCLIQPWLMYLALKLHDILFNHSMDAKDKPWLYPIYGDDAWHITHHKDYSQPLKVFGLQNLYRTILFSK